MVSILDNRKTAELVIKNSETEYEKINPETLAKVVEDESKSTPSQVANVQEHMDDLTIHFPISDVENLVKDNLKVENVKAGNNITIVQEPETNNITITASDHPTDGFLTKDNVKAEDNTITVTKSETNNDVFIKANFPEFPDPKDLLVRTDIKPGNDKIQIEYPEDSKEVLISATGEIYTAGDGIEISQNNEIKNTKPDQIVVLTAGKNILVKGDYPNFTLEASSGATIEEWKPDTQYFESQFILYNNSIYQCKETHISGQEFADYYWTLIAGYKITKAFYQDTANEIMQITLPEVVPNADVLFISAGGLVIQSQNYGLQPDKQTLNFYQPIPKGEIIEVRIAGNEVLNTYDNGANIFLWEPNQSYAVGNLTIYKDSILRCIENHITGETFDETKWTLIAGYTKDTYNHTVTEAGSVITLPYAVYDKNLLLVTVNGAIIPTSEYTMNSEYTQITLTNKQLAVNDIIEIYIYGKMTLAVEMIPIPKNKPLQYLRSKEHELEYELLTKEEVKQDLGFGTFNNNQNKYMKLNNTANEVSYLTNKEVASDIKVRKIVDGLTISINPEAINGEDDTITIQPGTVMANDGSTMIELKSPITKNPHTVFVPGNNNGSMVGTDADVWTQPVMTSATTPIGQVITSSEQTDREGWRAMDANITTGNGWLANTTTATWQYQYTIPLRIKSIDFYGQESTLNNRPKDIDVWVGNSSNVKASFTAPNENIVQMHVELNNPEWDTLIGLTIKNSYGTAVGMKHITFNGDYQTYVAKDTYYRVYIISNDDSSNVDIITSKQQSLILPNGYTKYAQIGSFRTDENWSFYDVYPEQDLVNGFVQGINLGKLTSNSLETWVADENNVPLKIIEYFQESTPLNGYIQFPTPFKHKCLYVSANGQTISEVSNTSFRVTGTTPIMWYAKGY